MAGLVELPADFDVQAYLDNNPDLVAAGFDAATHYLIHGMGEGRSYRRQRSDIAPNSEESKPLAGLNELPTDFDAKAYLEKNPDIAATGFDAATHYLIHGMGEGRSYGQQESNLKEDLRPSVDYDKPIPDRIAIVLADYRNGLYDTDEDAVAAIMDAIRIPTPDMCEVGDELIKGGDPSSFVWPKMIDRVRLEAYQNRYPHDLRAQFEASAGSQLGWIAATTLDGSL